MDDETFFDGERGCGLFLKTGEQLLLRLARKGEIPSFRLGSGTFSLRVRPPQDSPRQCKPSLR
jgi:hypothetical protein